MENCSEISSNSIILCEENKRKFILHNKQKKEIIKITVDGCVYTDQDKVKRCDFVLNYDKIWTILVELKGKDIRHAIAQIESTLADGKVPINPTKYAFIIASKVSPKSSTTIKYYEKKFKQQQIELKIENRQLEKDISYFM